MTTTSHHKPPTTHFDPSYAFGPPSHVFPPPTYMFPPPDTGFNYLRPSSSAFQSQLAPQTHVSTTNNPPACISTPTGTPDTCFDHQQPPSLHFNPNWHPRPQNACMIARMCVSPFVFFFWLWKCMYEQSYMCFLCFYLFIIHFYPQNMCMIAHTCVSYVFIHLLYIFTLKMHV